MLNAATQKSYDQRFALIRNIDADHLVTDAESASLTLMDAAQDSVFTYLGQTYYVMEKNTYQEMSEDFSSPLEFTMTELTCLCLETGDTRHFEFEYDDELEVSITLKKINFRALTDDDGQSIDGDDLDQIVDEADSIVYAGEPFYYDDDWAAVYKRNGKEEQVYMYEFANDAGTQSITIEEWKGSAKDEYRIYVSKPITPREITIIAKGGPVNETITT